MKRILSLLVLGVCLTALAAPTFQLLPGTPAGLTTTNSASPPPAAPPLPAAVQPPVQPGVSPIAAPSGFGMVKSQNPDSATTVGTVVAVPTNEAIHLIHTPHHPAPVAAASLTSSNSEAVALGATTASNAVVAPVSAASLPPMLPLAVPAPAANVQSKTLPSPVPAASPNPFAASSVGGQNARVAPIPAPPEAKMTAANASEIIPAGMIRFQAAPLEQVLDFYAEMVGRTMLRPAQLPAASITIKTQSDLTRAEALEALDAVLGLNGIAMIPIGQKFVKVVPIAQANQEGAPLNDQDTAALPELGQYITRVVQLKYTKPSELVPILTPFAKVPGSILPIDSNQMLVLRDYTENVKRMLELIDRIDVAVPSEFVSEVIPIKYALAADIASALSSIGGGGGSSGSSSTGSRGTTGRTLAGTQNTLNGINNNNTVNRTYNPNNPQGNANNALGGGAAGAQQTFAQRLQNIIQKAGASGDIELIGPNKIISDDRTNSLLVFATREDMATIKKIINDLDVVLAQVLIEAVIMDVTLGDSFNLGVSAGQRPQAVGKNSAVGGLINNANGQLGTGQSFLGGLVSSLVTNISSTGITNITSVAATYPTSDGLNYFGTLNQSLDVTVSALAGNNNVKVLARPRIQTSHAVPASFFVGETVPYVTGTYYNGIDNGSQSQYQQTQIGISLNVLPLINPEGLVVMDIQQQVQQEAGSVTIDGNQVPITQDENASAKVAVRDGDTIVLGGFIQDQKTDSKSGVPYLQNIPLLGALFRTSSTASQRRELLILIRPTVLPTPAAAARQTDIERRKLTADREAESEFNTEQAKRMKASAKKKWFDPEAQYYQAGQTNPPSDQPLEMK